MRDLTKPEELILDQLGIVWSAVIRLPPVHPADIPELAVHIHAAQNIIMARPAVEQQNDDRDKGLPEDDQRNRRTALFS